VKVQRGHDHDIRDGAALVEGVGRGRFRGHGPACEEVRAPPPQHGGLQRELIEPRPRVTRLLPARISAHCLVWFLVIRSLRWLEPMAVRAPRAGATPVVVRRLSYSVEGQFSQRKMKVLTKVSTLYVILGYESTYMHDSTSNQVKRQ